MKTCIISYSMTGNNEKLGQRISNTINAEHIPIKEQKKRNMGTVVLDVLFSRTPQVEPGAEVMNAFDQVILLGPVWMSQAASPLRTYFKMLKKQHKPYAFVTISGGALNKNPKLIKDIKKRAGDQITLLKDMYISDILNLETTKMKDTGDYQLTEKDIENLTEEAVASLNTVYTF